MKTKKRAFWRPLLAMVLVFALLFGGCVWLMDQLDTTSDEEQLSMVKDAVYNALVTCYAVEGGYPQSLDYLVENYGLQYNEERIAVFYDAFASNIMPEVRVSFRGDDRS